MRKLRIPEVHNQHLMPFRWRELQGRILLTNDAGGYLWLEPDDFGDFIAGSLSEQSPIHKELESKNFIRSTESEKNLMDGLARRDSHQRSRT